MPREDKPLRPCPFCREPVRADALRCKHCHASTFSAWPAHHGSCAYCKEDIDPEAMRCRHCRADLTPLAAAWSRAGQTRTLGKPAGLFGPSPATPCGGPATMTRPPGAEDAGCPPAILDSSPDGYGLGVWVYIYTDEHGRCVYRYSSGIA